MTQKTGPWYSLEEAKQKLEITTTELNYLISEQEITPVVFTKSRKFLLFRPTDDGWAGLAACQYRGHMSLHKNSISRLLDGDDITLGKGWGQLLEEKGVTQWWSEYPFRQTLPHSPLVEWLSHNWNEADLSRTAATPFPKETETSASAVRGIGKSFLKILENHAPPKDHDKSKPYTPPTIEDHETEYGLFFKENSLFTPNSLRIPDSEIQRYLHKDEPAKPLNP